MKAVNTPAVTFRQLWGDLLPLFGQYGARMLFRTSSLYESGGSQMEEDATDKSWNRTETLVLILDCHRLSFVTSGK